MNWIALYTSLDTWLSQADNPVYHTDPAMQKVTLWGHITVYIIIMPNTGRGSVMIGSNNRGGVVDD